MLTDHWSDSHPEETNQFSGERLLIRLGSALLVFLASYRGNVKAAPIMTVGKMAHRTALPLRSPHPSRNQNRLTSGVRRIVEVKLVGSPRKSEKWRRLCMLEVRTTSITV